MAADKKQQKQKKSKAASVRKNLPKKRSLNLATVGVKKINYFVAIPLIILILAGAALFSKFAVIDRMMAVSRAEAEVAGLQSQADNLTERLSGYGDLNDAYAHYTYSGMTNEELTRADRIAVMDLIDEVVRPNAVVGRWSITDNTLTIPVSGTTLQQINLIAQQMEESDLVSFCAVTTASTNDQEEQDPDEAVNGTLIAYLTERVVE